MAVIKAQASGNWSAVGTWSGGVVPSLNDTVYANGFTVAIDQSIDLTGSTVDTSGSFIPGQIYQIVSLGTTNFALTANCIVPGTNAGTPVAITSAVGQIFQAVNAGTATTGTARRMGALLNYINTPLTIVTGGGFTLAANWNITGAYIQAGSANCLTVSAAASSTLTGCYAIGSAFTLSTRAIAFSSSGTLALNGIVAIGGRVSGASSIANGPHAIESTSAAGTVSFSNASALAGGSGAISLAINNNSSGTVTVSSSTVTGGSGTSSIAIENLSTGTVSVSSSTVTGGSGTSSFSIENGSTGTVTISSSTVTGGSNATAYGVSNFSTGSLTVTGDVTASTGAGILNTSTGPVTINGTLTPTTTVHALQCTNTTGANVTLSGSLIYASNGFAPTNCLKFLMNPTPTMAKVRFAKNGSTTYSDFFTADNNLGQAAITDVRFGTVYASGALTGVAYIPTAGSVAAGVPVDNTVGTATLTAANVRAALGMASANLDTQLAAIPTAITNAAAVRTNLTTELGRIDATISSRSTLTAANVRTELAPELTQVTEVHKIHGLDIANALTVTPTLRSVGAITQAITGDGTTSTIVTRV